jgi:hypothetical protein
MFRDRPDWVPSSFNDDGRWAHFGAHARENGGIEIGWLGGEPEGARPAVRGFLEAELDRLELKAGEPEEASFVRLVAEREPLIGDDLTDVFRDGPFVEFAVGEYPSAPLEWPVVPLTDLISRALALLRDVG